MLDTQHIYVCSKIHIRKKIQVFVDKTESTDSYGAWNLSITSSESQVVK